MIELPRTEQAFEHENNFMLSSDPIRLGRILGRYELFKQAATLPGTVVECGVFKGVSFVQLATFRELMGMTATRPLVGFDTFTEFPPATHAMDRDLVGKFTQAAGSHCIGAAQLREVLTRKGLNRNIELVEGNVLNTIPQYAERHPELKICLLFLDTDTYESAAVILEHFYPRLVRGGILVLDDYGRVPGETKAVDEYFAQPGLTGHVEIRKSPHCYASSYVVKA